MKKKEKPRRLTLNRETILVLQDPGHLALARGGTALSGCAPCGPGTQQTLLVVVVG